MTPEKFRRERDPNPGSSALESDALTTGPTRRSEETKKKMKTKKKTKKKNKTKNKKEKKKKTKKRQHSRPTLDTRAEDEGRFNPWPMTPAWKTLECVRGSCSDRLMRWFSCSKLPPLLSPSAHGGVVLLPNKALFSCTERESGEGGEGGRERARERVDLIWFGLVWFGLVWFGLI